MTDSASRPLNVFLCHSSDDKPTVRELYKKLMAEGWIDVWLDEEKLLPGQDWEFEIEKALEKSDAVIVTLSSGSITKEGYIQKELRFVLDIAMEKPDGTIYVLPLRLNDCERPRKLRHIQAVDYFPPDLREKAYARLRLGLELRAHNLGIKTTKPGPIMGGVTAQTPVEIKMQTEQVQTNQEQSKESTKKKPVDTVDSPILIEGASWKRFYIRLGKNGSLTFSSKSGQKSLEETLQGIQKRNIDRLVSQAVSSPKWDQNLAGSLFELMIPNSLKGSFTGLDNLLFVLDEGTAQYPWELLHNRRSGRMNPLFIRVGMIRQFSEATSQKREVDESNKNILVIGNPAYLPQIFSDLPGAEQEAMLVADKFETNNYSVFREIHTGPNSIFFNLFANDYRVLHFAGHGVYRFSFRVSENEEPEIFTGMVLGEDVFLTVNEFRNLMYIPELVFINCAHLGKVDISSENSSHAINEFAASLPKELIEMGVKAVIAPGWAIDDQAAITFAEVFYSCMLNGEMFGDAVKEARQETYNKSKERTNTWAAYQCYGDPAYRLVTKGL